MEKEIYRQNLIKAIQIGTEIAKKCKNIVLTENSAINMLDWYDELLQDVQNPKLNMTNLNYYVNDFFIFYNESSGVEVEMFWKAIKEEGLPFERKDIIGKILKKKKLSKHEDYEYIMDVIQPFYEESKLTDEDIEKLNKLIDDFEKRG